MLNHVPDMIRDCFSIHFSKCEMLLKVPWIPNQVWDDKDV